MSRQPHICCPIKEQQQQQQQQQEAPGPSILRIARCVPTPNPENLRCVSHSPPAFIPSIFFLSDDGSGQPHDNILQLRSSKIRNFLSVKQFSNVKTFFPIRFEDMVRNGTHTLIRKLEKELNVQAKCQPIKGEPRKGVRPMSDEYIKYMKRHVDWKTEELIGYTAEPMR